MGAHHRLGIRALLPVAGLAACAQVRMGPTVQVAPGARKSFETYQHDHAACQQYLQGQVAGQAEPASSRAVGGAALGTLIGAGLGTVGGVGGSADAQGGIRAQHDNAYAQCIHGKGNRVAGLPDPERRMVRRQRAPVRQVVRARAVRASAMRAARAADWVAPAAVAGAHGGKKAPVAAEWVNPIQGK